MAAEHKLPGTFAKCEVCGEYNGTARARELNWNLPMDGDAIISVSCLCKGIPCPRCMKNLIHRPISNEYDPVVNKIWHYAWFTGMMPCRECREKDEAEEEETREMLDLPSTLSDRSRLGRRVECVVHGHRWALQSWHHPFPWCWARCERCGLEAQVPLEDVEGAP